MSDAELLESCPYCESEECIPGRFWPPLCPDKEETK